MLVPVRSDCSGVRICWRVSASRPLLAVAVVVGSVFLVEVGPFFWVLSSRLLLGFSSVSAQFAILGVIADSEYVDSMGYNGTSTLYANSSGPRISTIRPTAAWSTPAISLTLDSSRSMRSFSRRILPVDDVCSDTRTLY